MFLKPKLKTMVYRAVYECEIQELLRYKQLKFTELDEPCKRGAGSMNLKKVISALATKSNADSLEETRNLL